MFRYQFNNTQTMFVILLTNQYLKKKFIIVNIKKKTRTENYNYYLLHSLGSFRIGKKVSYT